MFNRVVATSFLLLKILTIILIQLEQYCYFLGNKIFCDLFPLYKRAIKLILQPQRVNKKQN